MDYLPASDGDRQKWLINLRDNYQAVLAPLQSYVPGPVSVKELCQDSIGKIQAVENSGSVYRADVKAKNGLEEPGGSIAELRREIAQWKTARGYTPAMGAALGIVGSQDEVDKASYKAAISGSVVGDVVRLKFKKLGADGVNIYRRRKGHAEWTFLARDTSSPYDDHIKPEVAGVPEHYEYVAYGVKKDEQFGEPSDIVQVVYGAIA